MNVTEKLNEPFLIMINLLHEQIESKLMRHIGQVIDLSTGNSVNLDLSNLDDIKKRYELIQMLRKELI